jgi:TRAP-type uncharacterized transport system fused permease subunit
MIMPPVMEPTFIIPEMIGGTYLDVVKQPLYQLFFSFYTTLYMVVELQAVKFGLRGFQKLNF